MKTVTVQFEIPEDFSGPVTVQFYKGNLSKKGQRGETIAVREVKA